MRQLATATGLDHFRYSGTATGPLKTGPNRAEIWEKEKGHIFKLHIKMFLAISQPAFDRFL